MAAGFAAGLVPGAAFFAAGTVRLLRAGLVQTLLLPALLLPAPILYLMSALRGDRFFTWYLLFALPGLVSVICAGATWPLSGREPRSLRSLLGAAACVVGLALFTWVARMHARRSEPDPWCRRESRCC